MTLVWTLRRVPMSGSALSHATCTHRLISLSSCTTIAKSSSHVPPLREILSELLAFCGQRDSGSIITFLRPKGRERAVTFSCRLILASNPSPTSLNPRPNEIRGTSRIRVKEEEVCQFFPSLEIMHRISNCISNSCGVRFLLCSFDVLFPTNCDVR